MVCLATSIVCRKPTHTDSYIHFLVSHPNDVKREIVRCLYRRARRVTNLSDTYTKYFKVIVMAMKPLGQAKELSSRDYSDSKRKVCFLLFYT